MNKIKSIASIGIIGSGNVAYHLLRAIAKSGHHTSVLYSRNTAEAKKISRNYDITIIKDICDLPTHIDIYVMCISDDYIESVAQQLPKSITDNCIVAHTSGSKSIDETLSHCKKPGVFYPLQTFTKGRRMNYNTIPFCIHAHDVEVAEVLFEIASSVSTNVNYIDDAQRKQIHLSAVWINNFVNHIIYKSETFLNDANIPIDILQPLLIETIKKQKIIGSKNAQTGPAIRNDNSTMTGHMDLLDDQNDQELYKIISQSIKNTYQ